MFGGPRGGLFVGRFGGLFGGLCGADCVGEGVGAGVGTGNGAGAGIGAVVGAGCVGAGVGAGVGTGVGAGCVGAGVGAGDGTGNGAGVGTGAGAGVGAVVGAGVVTVSNARRFSKPFPVTCTQAVRNSLSQVASLFPNCLISFAAGPVGLFLLPQSGIGGLVCDPQHCPLLPHRSPPVGKVTQAQQFVVELFTGTPWLVKARHKSVSNIIS